MKITDPTVEIFLLISFLSLLPAILVMFTSFTRVVIVLSFLRQAIGAQTIPPNTVIIGLAIFLTLFIMSPTIDVITRDSVNPYMDKQITMQVAFQKAEAPIKTFMLKQTRQKDIALFLNL
ncbi:MAG: flagellar type III secretion system pore protein FliP, partial [Thermodesulfovibrionales bacterium]